MSIWEIFKRKAVPEIVGLGEYRPASRTNETAPALQTFGLALLQSEVNNAPKRNVFVSPLSVFLALCMTQNGAMGETKEAIRRVLRLPADASDEAVNESAGALAKALRTSATVELAIANALWVDVRTNIAPDFLRVCEQTYDAIARTLDLNQPAAANIINDWASEATRGTIPQVVTPSDIAGMSAIIANAIYFKGKFSNPFPKDATRPKTFHLPDGRRKEVPMMRRVIVGDSYWKGRNFEAAVLPYNDSRIALYMLLPAPSTSPEQILTEASVQELVISRERCELDLSMPRFTLDFLNGLERSLTQMGMGIAFGRSADFSALGTPAFFIDRLLHKTRLEVDEAGTVAAAVTVATIATASGARPRPIQRRTLVFDRPFAVLLRDTMSGTILFAGVVYEP